MTSTATQLSTAQAYLTAVQKGLGAQLASGTVESVEALHTALVAARHDANVLFDLYIGSAERRAQELRAFRAEATLGAAVALLQSGAVSLAELAQRAGLQIVAPAAGVGAAQAVETPAAAAPAQPELPADKAAAAAGYKNGAKYMDPATGRVWSGMGPCPKWLKALFIDGKTLADFALKAEAAAEPAATESPAEPKSAQQQAAPETAAAPQPAQPQEPSADSAASEASEKPAAVDADIGSPVSFDASDFRADDIEETSAPSGDDGFNEMVSGLDAPAAGGFEALGNGGAESFSLQ